MSREYPLDVQAGEPLSAGLLIGGFRDTVHAKIAEAYHYQERARLPAEAEATFVDEANDCVIRLRQDDSSYGAVAEKPLEYFARQRSYNRGAKSDYSQSMFNQGTQHATVVRLSDIQNSEVMGLPTIPVIDIAYDRLLGLRAYRTTTTTDSFPYMTAVYDKDAPRATEKEFFEAIDLIGRQKMENLYQGFYFGGTDSDTERDRQIASMFLGIFREREITSRGLSATTDDAAIWLSELKLGLLHGTSYSVASAEIDVEGGMSQVTKYELDVPSAIARIFTKYSREMGKRPVVTRNSLPVENGQLQGAMLVSMLVPTIPLSNDRVSVMPKTASLSDIVALRQQIARLLS